MVLGTAGVLADQDLYVLFITDISERRAMLAALRESKQQLRWLIDNILRSNWIITNWWRPQGYYDQSAWRATWGGEGGGVLVNQAPHQLDLWQWICGVPQSVYSKVAYGYRRNIAVEDGCTAGCCAG